MSKIKIAIIGTGHWGPNLLKNLYDDPRVEIKAICDLDASRVQAIASRYKDIETSTDVKSIATQKDIDAIVLCTPTNTHYELGKLCLENNKHLFVEKPMATTSTECKELIRLATKRNRKLMVGHVFLYNPAVQYIKAMIDKGDLGDIIYVYGKRVNLGPIRKDVNALWDLAPHDIAIFNYWFKHLPLMAYSTGIEHLNPPLHDVVFLSLKYPNNIMASLQVSWLDPIKVRQIVVVGTKKMVVFDDLDPVGPVQIYDKSVSKVNAQQPITDTIQAYKVIIQEGDLIIPKISLGEPLRNECRAFIDYIVEGKFPASTGENGLEVVQVLEAATRSLTNSGIQTGVEYNAFYPDTYNEIAINA